LKKLGIEEAQRFPAVKMQAGNIGCALSHIKCVELAKSHDWPQVFICEDDITFTNPPVLMNGIMKLTDSNIPWDVLVIGGNNCPPFVELNDSFARVMNIQTTTGYIVKKHYYDILLDNFREGVKSLMREPDKKRIYSIDIYWKLLQQRDQWLTITPLTVIQYYDYSDIEEKVVDYGSSMLDMEKKALIEKYMREQQRKNFFGMQTK